MRKPESSPLTEERTFKQGDNKRGNPAWVEQYKDLVSRIKTEEDYDRLQAIYDNEVDWNLITHNTRSEDPLFTSIGTAIKNVFNVRTIIKGKKAEEIESVLRDNRIPLAKGVTGGPKKNVIRAIATKHLGDFARVTHQYIETYFLAESRPSVRETRQQARDDESSVLKPGEIVVVKTRNRRRVLRITS